LIWPPPASIPAAVSYPDRLPLPPPDDPRWVRSHAAFRFAPRSPRTLFGLRRRHRPRGAGGAWPFGNSVSL